jgi:hypothetical protein
MRNKFFILPSLYTIKTFERENSMHSVSLSHIIRTTIMGLVLSATLSAGAQMVNTTGPYNGSTVNPCNGETVSFSGSINYHEKTQVSTDGRIHFVANDTFNVGGNGSATGTRYNIMGTMQSNSKFPSFPIKFRQRSRFVSTGSAPSFYTTFVFHVNGNGVQTQVTTESTCN